MSEKGGPSSNEIGEGPPFFGQIAHDRRPEGALHRKAASLKENLQRGWQQPEPNCPCPVFGAGVTNRKVSGVHDQIQPEKKKTLPLLSANLYAGKCQQPSGKDKQ